MDGGARDLWEIQDVNENIGGQGTGRPTLPDEMSVGRARSPLRAAEHTTAGVFHE